MNKIILNTKILRLPELQSTKLNTFTVKNAKNVIACKYLGTYLGKWSLSTNLRKPQLKQGWFLEAYVPVFNQRKGMRKSLAMAIFRPQLTPDIEPMRILNLQVLIQQNLIAFKRDVFFVSLL